MNPERWRQVEKIYDEALKQEPGKRARFLVEACQGDAELLRDVESLLSQGSSAAQFLERPAWEDEATRLGDSTPALLGAGSKLGFYSIEGTLGAGGWALSTVPGITSSTALSRSRFFRRGSPRIPSGSAGFNVKRAR